MFGTRFYGVIFVVYVTSVLNTAYATSEGGLVADVLLQPAQLWKIEHTEKLQLLDKLKRFISNVFKAEVAQQRKQRLEAAAAREALQFQDAANFVLAPRLPSGQPYSFFSPTNAIRFRQKVDPWKAAGALMPPVPPSVMQLQQYPPLFPQPALQSNFAQQPPLSIAQLAPPFIPPPSPPDSVTYNKAGAFLDSLQPPRERHIAESLTKAVLFGSVPLNSVLALQKRNFDDLKSPEATAPSFDAENVSQELQASITPVDPMKDEHPVAQNEALFSSTVAPLLSMQIPDGPLSLMAPKSS